MRALLVVMLLLVPGTVGAGPKAASTARVGAPAPAFDLERLQGREHGDLTALRGRVVLVEFWATYCGWCKSTHPDLAQFAAAQGKDGVAVLGISSQARGRLARYLASHRLGFTVLHDARRRVARRYGVRGTPTLVVIDRAGVVRFAAGGAPAAERAIALAAELSR